MGYFITFEGGEGTGKSTQVQKLGTFLRRSGKDVVQTREPGGSAEAEKLRDLLVSGEPDRWSAQAEALLTYAAREHHLIHVIRPALAKGRWVICDRFMDSTRAYQGFAGGCPERLIDELEASIVQATRPSLTFIFDVDPGIGLSRARARGEFQGDRFERKGEAFHQKLRQGFLAIAAREPERCKLIDAAQDEEAVFTAILKAVRELPDG